MKETTPGKVFFTYSWLTLVVFGLGPWVEYGLGLDPKPDTSEYLNLSPYVLALFLVYLYIYIRETLRNRKLRKPE